MPNLRGNLWLIFRLAKMPPQLSLAHAAVAGQARDRLLYIKPADKDRDVPTSRNINPQRLLESLIFKVFIEPLSQSARVTPHDIVFAWVVIGRAIEDLRADSLLRYLMSISHKLLFADVQQKILKQVRFTEAFAGNDPKRQLPFLPQ